MFLKSINAGDGIGFLIESVGLFFVRGVQGRWEQLDDANDDDDD